jgi:hypothetical protein
MRDELISPAFAELRRGKRPLAKAALTTVMPCVSRHSLATADRASLSKSRQQQDDGRSPGVKVDLTRRSRFGEGGSHPHQSGSRRIAASRSDFKRDFALTPTAYDRMFPLMPAFLEGSTTPCNSKAFLGYCSPVAFGTRCPPMSSDGSASLLFRADSG